MVSLRERLRGLRPPATGALAGDGSVPPLEREVMPGSLSREERTVTRALYGRLQSEEVAQVERAIAESVDSHGIVLPADDPAHRQRLTLQVGCWLALEVIATRTGLPQAQPPDDIHAMARGPQGAAGGLYEADLVADAMLSVGANLAQARRGLDFGCSSGRVVRVLAAAFPEVSWAGADPNREAISWARQNLPGIDFVVSDNEPPLPFEPGSIDVAFAISIWSHFEPQLGLRWFEEMRRLIRPGGHLVITTHGLTTVAHDARTARRSADQCLQIKEALYRRGWWYAAEFGKSGDWGVVNHSWGTAFVDPEWLLGELCPRWRVLEYAAGRNSGNQDVYVLERA